MSLQPAVCCLRDVPPQRQRSCVDQAEECDHAAEAAECDQVPFQSDGLNEEWGKGTEGEAPIGRSSRGQGVGRARGTDEEPPVSKAGRGGCAASLSLVDSLSLLSVSLPQFGGIKISFPNSSTAAT